MFLDELTFPVSDVQCVGPSAVRSLVDLGIINVAQLIRHYPLRYEDRSTHVPLNRSSSQTPAVTVAQVLAHKEISWKKGLAPKIIISDGSETASMLCFGRNFLARRLPPGIKIHLTGPFERNKFGEIQSSSFIFEPYDEKKSPKNFGQIFPVYPLSGKLTQGLLRNALKSCLKSYVTNIRNELPSELIAEHNFPSKTQSLRQIHFPATLEEAKKAQEALIFEELFLFQFTVAKNRIRRQGKGTAHQWDKDLPARLVKTLPFDLTPDQKTSLREIRQDIERKHPMLRLLQGEVGSGKTLVAFLGCLGIIGTGRQAAIMAPTELLARQHADNAARLMENIGVRVAFLTGELTGKPRQALTEALAAGTIDLVIGTHALFSDSIEFQDLGLAVIDEQHRFGVQQRQALSKKGLQPDLLSLSATPIPRTLALTAFGDMDISSIRTMPKGRLPVETHLARMGNESKVYEFVRREIDHGRRAYFVYPLIEESEKVDLKNAENMFDYLSKTILSNFPGALIHSRIAEDKKRQIMDDFRQGKLVYLVATSVVEVGVDVAEASCMVIEHAERFGLSALHQLRGRVGRGKNQSYCFLLYSEPLTGDAKQRMLAMKNISNGFELAEEDLKLRGPGDMAGVRQSGFVRFSIADPVRDINVLLSARKAAQSLIKADGELLEANHRDIRELFETCPPFDKNLMRRGQIP